MDVPSVRCNAVYCNFTSGLSAANRIEKMERVQELLGRDLSLFPLKAIENVFYLWTKSGSLRKKLPIFLRSCSWTSSVKPHL